MKIHLQPRSDDAARFKPNVLGVLKDIMSNSSQVIALLLSGFLMLGAFFNNSVH